MIKNNRLLIDESPLTFQPTLAKTIGLVPAIFLQQLHFWSKLSEQRQDPKCYWGGRWWVYNSLKDWLRTIFTFCSRSTLERNIAYLIDLGVVLSRPDPDPLRGNWYSVDYDVLDRLDVLPPEANVEDAALAPEPEKEKKTPEGILLPTSAVVVDVAQHGKSARHVRGHAGSARKIFSHQKDTRTPAQFEQPPHVKLSSPPCSERAAPPRQIEQGVLAKSGGHLKGIKDQRELKETQNSGRAPEGAPASPPLTPRAVGNNPRAVGSNPRAVGTNPRAIENNIPAIRTGLVSLTLPAEETPMKNFFAAEPELWAQRIHAWRSGRKQETT